MNLTKLDKLFENYEQDFNNLDFRRIALNYPESFISAGPKGSIAQGRTEFEEKAEEAAGFYRSIGQKSARIISKEVIHISNEYCLVTVHWSVIFEKTGEQPVEFDVSYLVQEIQDEMKIILFISHEDEMEAMKKLGLKPEALT